MVETAELLEISARKLLEKFGAGHHKPGSGSASAYQALLATQLLRTVIELSGDAKRKGKYLGQLPKLLEIKQDIENRIYPELEALFFKDSEQFDKVIKVRNQRDGERNLKKKRELAHQAYRELELATEIPLKIAELSLQLGHHAVVVFDLGFKSARGDSNVALNNAVAAVISSLSVVELNLSILPFNDWMEEIKKRKAAIKLRYEQLSSKGPDCLSELEKESEKNEQFYRSIEEFKKGNLADSVRTDEQLEALARKLQNTLWLQKDKIFKGSIPKFPFEVLKPDRVFRKVLDYVYEEETSLGESEMDGELFEVAGLIDKTEKVVKISKSFKNETQRFTAAHELGHALLHRQEVQHRDRPIDGSVSHGRSLEEIQADKFAAYFLMPTTSVREVFESVFETNQFEINEGTALNLRENSAHALRRKCKNRRGLARYLASAEYYRGKTVISLAKVFGVSVETMAIRLEELELLLF